MASEDRKIKHLEQRIETLEIELSNLMQTMDRISDLFKWNLYDPQ